MSFRSGTEWVADVKYMPISHKLVVITVRTLPSPTSPSHTSPSAARAHTVTFVPTCRIAPDLRRRPQVEGSIYFYSFSPGVDFVNIVGRITGQRLQHGTPFCVECVPPSGHATRPGHAPSDSHACRSQRRTAFAILNAADEFVCRCVRARGRCFVNSQGKEVLLIGDDGGLMHRLTFEGRDWHACDGRLPNKCHKYEVFRDITCTFTQCHVGGWLTRIRYVSELGAIITASTNGEIRLWDADKMKMLSVYQHKRGVHNFDWSSVLRTLAFCGGDREVTLWNPYSKQKQATLSGHSAVVVQVRCPVCCVRYVWRGQTAAVWPLTSIHGVPPHPPSAHVCRVSLSLRRVRDTGRV